MLKTCCLAPTQVIVAWLISFILYFDCSYMWDYWNKLQQIFSCVLYRFCAAVLEAAAKAEEAASPSELPLSCISWLPWTHMRRCYRKRGQSCQQRWDEFRPLLGGPVGIYAGYYAGHNYKLGDWYHSRFKNGKAIL